MIPKIEDSLTKTTQAIIHAAFPRTPLIGVVAYGAGWYATHFLEFWAPFSATYGILNQCKQSSWPETCEWTVRLALPILYGNSKDPQAIINAANFSHWCNRVGWGVTIATSLTLNQIADRIFGIKRAEEEFSAIQPTPIIEEDEEEEIPAEAKEVAHADGEKASEELPTPPLPEEISKSEKKAEEPVTPVIIEELPKKTESEQPVFCSSVLDALVRRSCCKIRIRG